MRLFVFQIVSITTVVIFANCTSPAKVDSKEIPAHTYFIKKDIDWQDSPYHDLLYMRGIGKKAIDTMLILTNDKLILITGQYGLKPADTIVMPYSGEFGINYEVLKNDSYKLSKETEITLRDQKFVATQKARFEWWPELIDKIKNPGKGKIIVSGP